MLRTTLLRPISRSPHTRCFSAKSADIPLGIGPVIPKESRPTTDVYFTGYGQARIAVLNRTKALNALNLSMVRQLTKALTGYEFNKDISGVILRHDEGRGFCAGGDIVTLYNAGLARKRGEKTPGDITRTFFKEEYMLNYKISKLPYPYLAFMDGITMGGGVGISVHGLYRAATPNTVFAMPETAIGFFPDVGGSYFLPRLKGGLGLYLALTGARLKGMDVLHAGIATHFLDFEAGSRFVQGISSILHANNFATMLDISHEATVSRLFPNENENEKDYLPPFSLEPYLDVIDRCFSGFGINSVEDIINALQNETVHREWAQNTIKTLNKMSPTSLKVTFRLMTESAGKSLAECLQQEYALTQKFITGHDFYEGVKASLFEKTNNPKWNPPRLADVSDDYVDDYFASQPEDGFVDFAQLNDIDALTKH